MDLASFLAPVSEAAFRQDYFDRQPLHVPADPRSRRAGLFDWNELFDLLEVLPQWRGGALRLIMNSRPVPREHYVALRDGGEGLEERPDAGLIAAMMAMGASLVLDKVEDARVDLRRICAMLGQAFAGKAGVNIYCSQAGVQAFASHCDPHEVFVVQCDGEKDWRIYRDRAVAPTEATLSRDQAAIEAAKGPVHTAVTLRPGDLLYIPRGFYHDAVARTERSIHLTFAVQPLYGAALLDLVRDIVTDDPQFRAYLPSATAERTALGEALEALSTSLAAKLRSPALLEDIAVRQRMLSADPYDPRTPHTAPRVWRRTAAAARIEQPLEGSRIVAGSQARPLGLLSDTAAWVLAAGVFSERQVEARFAHHPATDLADLLGWFAERGLIEAVALG